MTSASDDTGRSPRPVTPVGIAGALLDSVVARIEAGEGATPGVRTDLARARDLVQGLDDYVARSTTPPTADLVDLEHRTRAEPWTDSPGPLEQEMLSGAVESTLR